MDDALAALGRSAGLTREDWVAVQALRDRPPAEPINPESSGLSQAP